MNYLTLHQRNIAMNIDAQKIVEGFLPNFNCINVHSLKNLIETANVRGLHYLLISGFLKPIVLTNWRKYSNNLSVYEIAMGKNSLPFAKLLKKYTETNVSGNAFDFAPLHDNVDLWEFYYQNTKEGMTINVWHFIARTGNMKFLQWALKHFQLECDITAVIPLARSEKCMEILNCAMYNGVNLYLMGFESAFALEANNWDLFNFLTNLDAGQNVPFAVAHALRCSENREEILCKIFANNQWDFAMHHHNFYDAIAKGYVTLTTIMLDKVTDLNLERIWYCALTSASCEMLDFISKRFDFVSDSLVIMHLLSRAKPATIEWLLHNHPLAYVESRNKRVVLEEIKQSRPYEEEEPFQILNFPNSKMNVRRLILQDENWPIFFNMVDYSGELNFFGIDIFISPERQPLQFARLL